MIRLLTTILLLAPNFIFAQDLFKDFHICNDGEGRLRMVKTDIVILQFNANKLESAVFGDSIFTYDAAQQKAQVTSPAASIRLTGQGPVLEHNGKVTNIATLDLSKVASSCEGVGVVNTRINIGDLEISYLYNDCKIMTIDLISGKSRLSVGILRDKQELNLKYFNDDSLISDIGRESLSIYNDLKEAGIGLAKKKDKVESIIFYTYSLTEPRITEWVALKIFYNKDGRVNRKTLYKPYECQL